MIPITLKLVLAGILATAAPAAQAAITVYSTVLNGAKEVPPNASAGIGTAIVTLDDVANTLGVNEVFSGLGSGTSGAHIHCCIGPAGNSGIAIGFNAFPLGVTSGSFTATFNLLDSSVYTSGFLTASGGTALGARNALVAGLNSGLAYANIHTGQLPGGEIRGQLIAGVPEPASWALMIGGFTLAGGALRRRRTIAGPAAA